MLYAELQLVGPVDSPSPVMHVQLPFVSGSDRDADAQLLQNIADRALKDSRVLFTVHKRSALDKVEMPPSIRYASRVSSLLFMHM